MEKGLQLQKLMSVMDTTREEQIIQDVSCGSSLSVEITNRYLKFKQVILKKLKITQYMVITMQAMVIVTAKLSVGKIAIVLASNIMGALKDAIFIEEEI